MWYHFKSGLSYIWVPFNGFQKDKLPRLNCQSPQESGSIIPQPYHRLPVATGTQRAGGLPSQGWQRVLRDGGLAFGTFFCLMIANAWNWLQIMWREGGGKKEKLPELQGHLSCCSTMAELRAKCLFHPLRSQLNRVTHCWPHLSPAVIFDSIFVRHHEAMEKARG